MSRRKRAVLATHQKRLRHLTAVHVRNLRLSFDARDGRDACSATRLPSLYFTLHVAPSADAFYTSEVVADSTNPSWRHFDMDMVEAVTTAHRGQRCVTLRIWQAACSGHLAATPDAAHPPKLLAHWDVDFYGLAYFGKHIEAEAEAARAKFAANTLLVQLRDGLYCPPQSIPEPSAQEKEDLDPVGGVTASILRVETSLVRRSYTLAALGRVHTLQRTIGQVQTAIDGSRHELQSRLHANERLQRLRKKTERARLRVGNLQGELLAQRNLLHREKEAAHEQHRLMELRGANLREAIRSLTSSIDHLKMLKREHGKRTDELNRLLTAVRIGQVKKILSLTRVYPIRQMSQTQYTICDLELPNSNFQGCDEETVSTALGYVCHLIIMVAKYLEVPFRYPMSPMCSRSTIKDEISKHLSDKEREFPLYIKGKERYAFEYGVFLLNKNIQQLLNYADQNGPDLRNTLPNLRLLMKTYQQLQASLLSAEQQQKQATFKPESTAPTTATPTSGTASNGTSSSGAHAHVRSESMSSTRSDPPPYSPASRSPSGAMPPSYSVA